MEAFAYRKTRNEDDTISLNEEQRLQEKSDRENFWLALENKKRVALGQEPIASLDELDEEEPTIASNDASAASPASVPTTGESETAEPASNSEMVDSNSAIPVAGADDAREEPGEEESSPDPYLVESGHILLDLISLEERTAAGLKQSRDT